LGTSYPAGYAPDDGAEVKVTVQIRTRIAEAEHYVSPLAIAIGDQQSCNNAAVV
jgi:hypothetical protein